MQDALDERLAQGQLVRPEDVERLAPLRSSMLMSMANITSPSQKLLLKATVAPFDHFLSLLKSFSKFSQMNMVLLG